MSEKYEFIDAEYDPDNPDAPTITQMCGGLTVSRSSFYEWRSRPASATRQRREEIKRLITTAFADADGT